VEIIHIRFSFITILRVLNFHWPGWANFLGGRSWREDGDWTWDSCNLGSQGKKSLRNNGFSQEEIYGGKGAKQGVG